MIVDYTCSRCGTAHALPPDQCPFDGRPPRHRVARGLTVEEIYAQKRKALELKHAIEDRERQREEEKLERKKALERARLDEDRKQFHQKQVEQLRGELLVVREQRDQQARARRLARNLQQRERRRDG